MKINVKSLVEQVVKEEMDKMQEAKPFSVNKKYTHFAKLKSNDKIITGWETVSDIESLKQYAKEDLKDMDIKPSAVTILSVKGLKDKGIDPFNWNSWVKNGEIPDDAYLSEGGVKEAVTTFVTPDGKTLDPDQKAKMKMAKPGATVVVKKAGELSEDIYNDVLAAKGKTINVTLEDGTKVSLEVSKVDTVDGEYSADNGDIITTPPRSSTEFGKKSKFYFKPKGERGLAKVIKSANDEESKKLLQALFIMTKKESEGNRVPAAKEFTKWSGLKEGQDLQEKKAKEAEEEAPAENPEAPAEEAPVEDQTAGTASSELNQHISAAIDSAAKAIEASQDAKYEKVLGKVIKNLTAAQASLADVEAVESKLNEQKLKEEAKLTETFRKKLRKELGTSFKNPQHINLILKKYDKVAKTASKENRPVQKIAEIITRHALNEGLIKKGDLLS